MARPPAGERTPWFAGDVPPTRKGCYERQMQLGTVVMSRFDGKKWHISAKSLKNCMKTPISGYQVQPWRGLASKL